MKHRLNEIDDEIKEADVSGDYERGARAAGGAEAVAALAWK